MAVQDGPVGSREFPGAERDGSSAVLLEEKSAKRSRFGALQRPLIAPLLPFPEEFYQYFERTRHRLSIYGFYAYWAEVLLTSFQTLVLLPLLLPGYDQRNHPAAYHPDDPETI